MMVTIDLFSFLHFNILEVLGLEILKSLNQNAVAHPFVGGKLKS
jgi:hypothetical protein